MHIIFLVTENCNLKCYYCSRGCHNDVDDFCSIEDFSKIINFMKAQDREIEYFQFFGGEPTTHPHLREMAYMLAENFDFPIQILSNMLQPIEYYTEFPKNTKFCCAFHSHGIGGDEWMVKVLTLHEMGMVKDVKMVITPRNEALIKDLFYRNRRDDFYRYEIVVEENLEGTEWANRIREEIDPEDLDYIGEYKPRGCYKGSMCDAGYRISPSGDLYHCWRKYNHVMSKPIMNLFRDEPRSIDPWHLCTYMDCDVNDVEFTRMSIKDYVAWKNENSKK